LPNAALAAAAPPPSKDDFSSARLPILLFAKLFRLKPSSFGFIDVASLVFKPTDQTSNCRVPAKVLEVRFAGKN
jgi:hypothetical protein